MQPVTLGPKHHFFGFFEKTPWNHSESLLSAHEIDFNDRPPSADDSITIGVIDLRDSSRYVPLAQSYAWNWQQGSMLQWQTIGTGVDFFHNDRRNGRFVAVARDVEGREIAEYGRPIYAISPNGRTVYSANFTRLATFRPGYGYAGLSDPHLDDACPKADGLWVGDLQTGEFSLAISLHELASSNPKPSMRGGHHYVNHIQPSRTGENVAFFHIWTTGSKSWEVRLYICSTDGSDPRCILDTGEISHFDWLADHSLLVWAKNPDDHDLHFLEIETDGSVSVFGQDELTEDGHCSFSPNRRWVLKDT